MFSALSRLFKSYWKPTMEAPRSELETAKQQVSDIIELYNESPSEHFWELFSIVHGIPNASHELKQRAHYDLLLLYGLAFRHALDHRHRSPNIEYRPQAAFGSLAHIAELVVARATEAAQTDLRNGFCKRACRSGISMDALQEQFETAVHSLRKWQHLPKSDGEPPISSLSAGLAKAPTVVEYSSTASQKGLILEHKDLAGNIAGSQTSMMKRMQKNKDPILSTTPASRTTAFNLAIFKRLPTGKSGQKNYEAQPDIPMRYDLSQKKVSKDGKQKKPVFAVDFSDDAIVTQARAFSHSKFSEMSLTDSSTLQIVTLVVVWKKQSIDFATRLKVEARVDMEATDLGQLVAFAVVMKDYAEQETIDDGWPDEREEWQWERQCPDVKTVVRYRPLG